MANTILDFLELSPDGVVVLKEQLSLLVDAEQFFEGDVTVTFRGFFTDDAGADQEITFSEALKAVNAPARGTANLKTSRIAWVANLGKGANPDAERHACTVIFTVSGVGVDGRRVTAQSGDKIIVRPIGITTDPRLTRIMVHEFSRAKAAPAAGDDDPFEFDPAPVQAYVDSLAPQQKKLLLNLKPAKPEGRLVVLITLCKQKPLRMCADFGPGNGSAHPNATFSVFHCQGPDKDVTLVCHTEHFLLNLTNGRTNTWIHTAQKGKAASVWLKKSNPAPPEFKIGSMLPQGMCDGVIWSRVFTAGGQDIMLGNTMHGFINTIGCWMLFRNYNWPVDKAARFDRIYRKLLRIDNSGKSCIPELAKPENGYDAPVDPTNTVSSSLAKFAAFDMNFAYHWFFHDVVGIKYISDRWRFALARRVNDFRTHGKTFFNRFPLDKIDRSPQFNLPDEGTRAYHDSVQRQRDERGFVPDDTLWRTNALGFKASEGFLPQKNGIFANLTAADMARFTWADLYVYAEDDVDITKLTANYTEKED
jgi:hypothetical protein